jgi:hypothetical protein
VIEQNIVELKYRLATEEELKHYLFMNANSRKENAKEIWSYAEQEKELKQELADLQNMMH